jgi:hypothetical protein
MLGNDLNGRLGSPKGSQVTVPLLADGISLKLLNKQFVRSPQFFYKNNQAVEACVALLLGNCFF